MTDLQFLAFLLAVPAVSVFLAAGLFARALSQPNHVYASATGQGCLVALSRLVQVAAVVVPLIILALAA